MISCENLMAPLSYSVDVVDQHFLYYAIGRRGVKWWRHVFYRLLEMAIVNAFSIYKMNNPDIQKKITFGYS